MIPTNPRISVIVAAYNSRDTVAQCLTSLLELDHPSYEVIVVDDGSTDDTAEICASFEGVELIRLDRGGPSKARNIGIKAAQGDIIALTDSDCIVERDWLRELEKGFEDECVAGVGGDQISPEGETEFGRSVQEFFKTIGFVTDYITTENRLKETHHNPSCNAAYRKRILEAVGGFAEDQFPCEDVEIDLKIRRLGYKLMYNPAAVVGHFRSKSYGDFARMMRRYGSGEWHLWRKHGFFRKLDYEPWVLVLCILGVLALVGLTPNNLFPLSLGAFAGPWVWFTFRTRDPAKSWRFAVLFLLTVIHWNLGFFKGFRYRPVS